MGVFGRHRFGEQKLVNLLKVGVHICERAHTKRALIATNGVLVKTKTVHGVATSHEDDGLGRGEEIAATDRAVCMEGVAKTAMMGL